MVLYGVYVSTEGTLGVFLPNQYLFRTYRDWRISVELTVNAGSEGREKMNPERPWSFKSKPDVGQVKSFAIRASETAER
jgi:hypothetical protein